MDGPVSPFEPLARFIFDGNKVNAHRVHFRAFLDPDPAGLSVFRTLGLSQDEIWAIGFALARGVVRGRGDFQASAAIALGLVVNPDEPPERHALITEWPTDTDQRRSVAQQIAAAADPVLPQ